jgi:site-specific DNA recombinase
MSRNSNVNAKQVADPSVRCATYARFSCDRQRDESITDQQRHCGEKARENGHAICRELEFSDEAVSGTKLERAGLNALLAAAESGQFDVLYVYSLSRLSRESVITLPLLKKLVYNHGIRVVSATEGIDSRDSSWEIISHIMSIVHEQYVKDLAKNVFRGQEGVVLSGRCAGDYCFGYGSIPVPGSEPARPGRGDKPPKMYVIDPQAAAWVERIFQWFVQERRSLRWIAQELNRRGVPKDHRATTPRWTHRLIAKLLGNRKYIGQWPWGERKNVRDPLTGKVRQVARSPEECEKWVRDLPHLRLVDDPLFEQAQQLLRHNCDKVAGNRGKKGQLQGSPYQVAHRAPCHLLSQLIVCGHCGRAFQVGGSQSKYLFCPGYLAGTCSCKTQLLRERAERMILSEIGRRVLENPLWQQRVFEVALRAWQADENVVPQELAATQRRLAEVDQKINNLLDRMEAGRGGPELDERLAKRRAEKRELADRVQRLQRADDYRLPEPTLTSMAEQLHDLGVLFTHPSPAAAHALRNLVGGGIVVSEIRRPNYQRHYLQGRFAITAAAVAACLARGGGGVDCDARVADDGPREKVVIDFCDPPAIDAQANRAKELRDQGWAQKEIAQQLGCSRSRVTAVLKHWYNSRGLTMPDGRSSRQRLRESAPPLYQQLADQVMDLYRQQCLLQDIADQLGLDRNTVTKAKDWWHSSRQLPVPDGRTRRKELPRKTSTGHESTEAA